MKVLLIGLNYLPESTSIGPYTAELAEYLVEHQHQVVVVTGFPAAPQWGVWAGYRGKWFMRERIHGVPVYRTFLFMPANPRTTLNRILFDWSFTLSALLGGLAAGPCDIIVVVSPPLQLGLTGWLLGLAKRVPFVFHIQDLVPDAAIATGMLQENHWVVGVARLLERFIYARARAIGVISRGFASNLSAKGVAAAKLALLPNYIDLEFVRPQARDSQFRRAHHIADEEFVVMYSGSVALKQGLHTFVDAAAEFGATEGVTFYLVGEGPYLVDLQTRANAGGLHNLHFLPLQPRETLPAQLAAADVLAITQKAALTDVVFPGKLLYYMAAGRPIVAAVSAGSETGRFIGEWQVGIVVPPEEPGAMAEAIRYLKQNRLEADRLGQNARKTVEEQFDRRPVLAHFARYLESLTCDA